MKYVHNCTQLHTTAHTHTVPDLGGGGEGQPGWLPRAHCSLRGPTVLIMIFMLYGYVTSIN